MTNEIVLKVSEKWLSYTQNNFYRIRSTIYENTFKILLLKMKILFYR